MDRMEGLIMWILSCLVLFVVAILCIAWVMASEYFKIPAGEPLNNFENFVIIALTIIAFNSFRK